MTHHSKPQSPRVKPVYDDQNELDPVLYDDEDVANYKAFHAQIWEALAPGDEVEKVLARSFIKDHWDAMRYRCMLPKFVSSCEHEGLRALLETLRLPPDRLDQLVAAFSVRESDEEIDRALASAGHDRMTVRAKTLALNIDTVGKIEAMAIGREKRRDRCLRDLMHRQRTRQANNAKAAKA